MRVPHPFMNFAPLRNRYWTTEANAFSGRALGTKLYVGGKIFGQEDEPAPLPEVGSQWRTCFVLDRQRLTVS